MLPRTCCFLVHWEFWRRCLHLNTEVSSHPVLSFHDLPWWITFKISKLSTTNINKTHNIVCRYGRLDITLPVALIVIMHYLFLSPFDRHRSSSCRLCVYKSGHMVSNLPDQRVYIHQKYIKFGYIVTSQGLYDGLPDL